MKKPGEFIIIDDDETTNMLCGIMLRKALGSDTVLKTFTLADNGIHYLKESQTKADPDTIIFLDINMPVTTGWDALKMIEELDDTLKKHVKIFMLSSSIDPNDKKRAFEHPIVIDFVEKPLTVEKIGRIFV